MTRSNATNFIQKNGLQLTVQIVGVLVLGLNTFMAAKLVPLTERVIKLENKVDAIDIQHDHLFSTMTTKDDLQLIITRIDKISSRLDSLIAILIKPQFIQK